MGKETEKRIYIHIDVYVCISIYTIYVTELFCCIPEPSTTEL